MYVYKYSVDIYLLCMIKVRVRWCTFSLCENVITLGELIGLLILFCHTLLSILFLKIPKIRGIPRSPCNGNHFSSVISN